MVAKAAKLPRQTLALYDFLLLSLFLLTVADLRMFAHGRMETAALATVALISIVGSAIAEWKLLAEGPGEEA